MDMARKTFLIAATSICLMTGSQATLINILNKCPFPITAFARHGSSPTNRYQLQPHTGRQQLDVGQSFPAGIVFASKSGSDNNAQTTQLEITVGANGHDFYDISLVNAYNLPAAIQPFDIKHDSPKGRECGTPTCNFNIQRDCTGNNVKHGDFCTNTDGPGNSPTANTKKFKTACPSAYSYSKDDQSSTYSCTTGTNYNFIYCPSGPSLEVAPTTVS